MKFSFSWSTLQIETNEAISDDQQAYAAGYLEGYLTKDLISLHILNTLDDFCDDMSSTCQKVLQFLQDNFNWMNSQIEDHPDDPYWHQVIRFKTNVLFFIFFTILSTSRCNFNYHLRSN